MGHSNRHRDCIRRVPTFVVLEQILQYLVSIMDSIFDAHNCNNFNLPYASPVACEIVKKLQ